MGVESELRSMTPMLNDPDLSAGERKYLYSIARIYSTSQMKALKQDQYHQLLFKELAKGYHSPKEYERYLNYLNTPRKTQYGKLDNFEEMSRARSAPPPTNSDACGRGGESEKLSRKKRVPPQSSRSWAPSMISSNSRISSTPSSSRVSTRQKTGTKKKSGKRRQSPPPAEKAGKAEDDKAVRSKSPEPVCSTAKEDEDEDDGTPHTRKEEGDQEELNAIPESEEASKAKTESEGTPAKEQEQPAAKEQTPRENDEGLTPRKGDDGPSPRRDDFMSPRKGEEIDTGRKSGDSPRQSDSLDGPASETGKQSSQDTAAVNNNNNNMAASSSNTTSNNFLALIVSDAEKDDDSKTAEESEQDKRSIEEPPPPPPQGRGSAEESTTPESAIPRDFSDTQLASGYSPRVHKEGRNRPLSRAGRPNEIRDRANSDDDYDDTDEETEKTDRGVKDEIIPEETSKPSQQPATDSARTDDDSKPEERGGEHEGNATTISIDKRAGSPEEGRDERAEESLDREGQRSVIIPISTRASNDADGGATLDLSAENKNRDVEKIEY